MNQVSRVSDIVLPIEDVDLIDLKTKDGKPARVRCEAVNILELTQIFEALPGARPTTLLDKDAPIDPKQAAEFFEKKVPALIETATSLVGDDGSVVRPAFWFNTPGPGIPGRYLSANDVLLLTSTIMRLAGFPEATAAMSTFLDQKRRAAVDVVRTVGSEPQQSPIGADASATLNE